MIRLYSGEQYESNSGNYLQHIRQTYTESTEVRNCHCLHATATALLDGSIWRRVCVCSGDAGDVGRCKRKHRPKCHQNSKSVNNTSDPREIRCETKTKRAHCFTSSIGVTSSHTHTQTLLLLLLSIAHYLDRLQ